VPRVAEDRLPAEPASPQQLERFRRILGAAARHAADRGLDRVQMHEVAREAGVAIATLYRYFPSKTQLFAALMRSRVQRLSEVSVPPGPGESAADGISRLLVLAGRELMRTPLLAQAMMQANNLAVVQAPDFSVSVAFCEIMLVAGGIDDPTPHDLRLLRLLEQTWYAIVTSALNHHIGPAELEEDTRLACRLLLQDREPAELVGC